MKELPVIFFRYSSRQRMSLQFMRLEEYYENPELSGKVNSQQKIVEWWKKKHKIDYMDYWDGFNIPSKVVEPFIKAYRGLLTWEEKDGLRKLPEGKYYIICGINNSTLQHELHHALFYIDANYRRKILSILKAYKNTKRIEAKLISEMGYSVKSIKDETAAYLIDGGKDLEKECGIDLIWYREVQLKLLQAYTNKIIQYVKIKVIEED